MFFFSCLRFGGQSFFPHILLELPLPWIAVGLSRVEAMTSQRGLEKCCDRSRRRLVLLICRKRPTKAARCTMLESRTNKVYIHPKYGKNSQRQVLLPFGGSAHQLQAFAGRDALERPHRDLWQPLRVEGKPERRNTTRQKKKRKEPVVTAVAPFETSERVFEDMGASGTASGDATTPRPQLQRGPGWCRRLQRLVKRVSGGAGLTAGFSAGMQLPGEKTTETNQKPHKISTTQN